MITLVSNLRRCRKGRGVGGNGLPESICIVDAIRVTGSEVRSALAFLGVPGRAVPTLIMMMVLFPVVAFPVAMTIPIAVAMPTRRNDDCGRRRRRDHDRGTHVNAYVDIGRVSRAGQADSSGSKCQPCECLFRHGTVAKISTRARVGLRWTTKNPLEGGFIGTTDSSRIRAAVAHLF
jgi:hypothetical protein